jgi:hypothetical protein
MVFRTKRINGSHAFPLFANRAGMPSMQHPDLLTIFGSRTGYEARILLRRSAILKRAGLTHLFSQKLFRCLD